MVCLDVRNSPAKSDVLGQRVEIAPTCQIRASRYGRSKQSVLPTQRVSVKPLEPYEWPN